MNELLEQGYAIIQLAHANRFSVNTDTCSSPNSDYSRNNCAGEVREEVIIGIDQTPLHSTDLYNGVDFRLQTLLLFLHDRRSIILPDAINPNAIDWSKLRISGHSQGATMTYYLARKRLVQFACIIAGPYDSPDSVSPGSDNLADWMTTGSSVTPLSKIGSIIATADSYYTDFNYAHSLIGLVFGQNSVLVTQSTFTDEFGNSLDGHSRTIKDPTLKAQRAQECFK